MERVDTYLLAANQVIVHKIKNYCLYQPRTHQQVRQKLYNWKLAKNVVESILAALIEENLVSESRFATAYAGERFRINRWGKKKVEQELKKRQISPYCIRQAMAEVNPSEYEKELRRLAEKKWSSFHGKQLHLFMRAKKTAAYLIGKGYETGAVWDFVCALQYPEKQDDAT
jgi:regulatory protein